MFLLTLCLIGFAAAAPAIPDAPVLPGEFHHVLMSPYIAPLPLTPLRALEIKIEPEPKEENAELPEPKEELPESELAAEEPKLEEPMPTEPVVVKLDVPKPPNFISEFLASLPINWPYIPYLTPWLSPSSTSNPPKILYPAFYSEYPGAVIVDATKP